MKNLEQLEKICKKYDEMQTKFGDENLNSIYFGGCTNKPKLCLVFMNPTKRNIASDKNWKGLKAPWIGTKNIWDLFFKLEFISENTYNQIKAKKGNEWDEQFAKKVYDEVEKNKIYITNLAKCTQIDARELSDEVYKKYLNLFFEELDLVNPSVVILFGNQVSSIVLNQRISVSKCRKQEYCINNKYKCYPVYYPVGNGRFNIDKAIQDLKYIIDTN